MGRPKGSKNKAKDEGKAVEKKPRKKPEQSVIPGTDHDRIKELDALGARFFEIRDARIQLSQDEGKLQGEGLALLHKHNRQRYTCLDGSGERYELRIESGEEKLKVKKLSEPKTDTPPAAEVTAS